MVRNDRLRFDFRSGKIRPNLAKRREKNRGSIADPIKLDPMGPTNGSLGFDNRSGKIKANVANDPPWLHHQNKLCSRGAKTQNRPSELAA